MKKQRKSNLVVLSIAVLALFFAGSSVYADQRQSINDHTAYNERESEEPDCTSGGCGSNQCSVGSGVSIFKIGVNLTHGVSCESGYYACCNIGQSNCIPATNCPDLNDTN